MSEYPLNRPDPKVRPAAPAPTPKRKTSPAAGQSGAIAAPEKEISAPVAQTGAVAAPKKKIPFAADKTDVIFAILAFAIGYLFIRFVFFSWRGFGVSIFTLCYCLFVFVYVRKKLGAVSRAGVFWLIVTLLTGLSFAFWDSPGISPWRELFLFCSAVYSALAATGTLILGKTGNWILLDAVNGLLLIPFKNFICQYRSFGALKYDKNHLRTPLAILLGLFLTLLIAVLIIPQLLAADGGTFAKITSGIRDFFSGIFVDADIFFLRLGLSIPVSAYIFALAAGSAHKRRVIPAAPDKIRGWMERVRVVPGLSAYIFLSGMCAIYAIFILSQLSYFFSAFSGALPEGYLNYAEYARGGFFELCRIGVINLLALTAANILCKKPRTQNTVLKVFNILLMLFTVLIIATAMSKMWLYVDAYGLTMRRLLPCILMAVMAAVCVAVIVLQKRGFSIMRFAAGLCAVTMCVLCFVNLDYIVVSYNAERYINGTLPTFDTEILYRAELAGERAAERLYKSTDDENLRISIEAYLESMETKIDGMEISRYTMEAALASARLKDIK